MPHQPSPPPAKPDSQTNHDAAGGSGALAATAHTRLTSQAWEGLFRAQVTVMRQLSADPIFKTLALREYDVLFNLSRCPEGWTRLNDLNEHLLISQPSLSRMVDRLEAKGLVQRRRASCDHRGVELALTDSGAELQKVIGRAHVRHIRRIVGAALDADELRQLTVLTEKLRAAASAPR